MIIDNLGFNSAKIDINHKYSKQLTSFFNVVNIEKHCRGVEQLVACRAHNPEVEWFESLPRYHFFCGGVAQLVRAAGSYPAGRGFDSNRRYQVNTRASSSNRLRHRPFTAATGVRTSLRSPHYNIKWGHSSAGRAHALHAWGHRFEPCCPHHNIGHESHGSRPIFYF